MSLSRRHLLKGAGGFALALPWLEVLSQPAVAQAVNRPRRMVVFVHSQGMAMTQWSPASDTLATLPSLLAPLDPFKSKLLMIEGLDNRAGYLNNNLGGHFSAFSTLTGEAAHPNLDASGNFLPAAQHTAVMNAYSGGPSIEQVISSRTRAGQPFASVDLAIGCQDQPRTGTAYTASLLTPGYGARFFSGRNQPVPSESNPFAAFARLFSTLPPNQADQAAEQLRLQRISVLDKVRESFTAFSRRVGTEDRQRLDAHATKVRDLELRLTAAMPPAAMCGQPWSQVPLATSSQYWVDEGAVAPLQHRMLAMAMACNLAPVGTVVHDRAHNPEFRWLNGGNSLMPAAFSDWHGMVHLGRTQTNPVTHLPELIRGYGWYVQSFANLLQELSSIPEDGRTVLDNTLVLWVSEFGEGFGHQQNKLPVIVAGNAGGATLGRVLRVPTTSGQTTNYYTSNFYSRSHQCLNNLYVSLLQAFGQSDTQFGRTGAFMVNGGVTIDPGPLVGFNA